MGSSLGGFGELCKQMGGIGSVIKRGLLCSVGSVGTYRGGLLGVLRALRGVEREKEAHDQMVAEGKGERGANYRHKSSGEHFMSLTESQALHSVARSEAFWVKKWPGKYNRKFRGGDAECKGGGMPSFRARTGRIWRVGGLDASLCQWERI